MRGEVAGQNRRFVCILTHQSTSLYMGPGAYIQVRPRLPRPELNTQRAEKPAHSVCSSGSAPCSLYTCKVAMTPAEKGTSSEIEGVERIYTIFLPWVISSYSWYRAFLSITRPSLALGFSRKVHAQVRASELFVAKQINGNER